VRNVEERIAAARSLHTERGDSLAHDYESQLEMLQQSTQLEQLDNVQVAIKVR